MQIIAPNNSYIIAQASRQITSVGDGLSVCQIRNPTITAGKVMGLLSLAVQLETAVQSIFGLIAPATAGTANASESGLPVSLGKFQAGLDTSGQGLLTYTWTVAPTFAVTPAYYNQTLLPATVGAAFEWSWPEDNPFWVGLNDRSIGGVPELTNTSLVLRNITGGACADVIVTAKWVELQP